MKAGRSYGIVAPAALALVAILAGGFTSLSSVWNQSTDRPNFTEKARRALDAAGFEANRGQAGAAVKFIANRSDYGLSLMPDGARFEYKDPAGVSASVRMSLKGANQSPRMIGIDGLSAKTSYFFGRDPARWVTGVPTFGRVLYKSVYRKVDLVFYEKAGRLEYDFNVAPGGDPSKIALRFTGRGIRQTLSGNGDLVLHTRAGEVRHARPVIYQQAGERIRPVTGGYRVQSDGYVTFRLGRYDRSLPLVIDPAVLTYSTYFGADNGDEASGISVDSQGNAYIAGPGYAAIGAGNNLGEGASLPTSFVAKLNSSGSGLLYKAYFPASTARPDIEIADIAVNESGEAFITGTTASTEFPTTPGAFQTQARGSAVDGGYSSWSPNCDPGDPAHFAPGPDAFVAKLSKTGDRLVYSSYLGASGHRRIHGSKCILDEGLGLDEGKSIAIDGEGNAYVAGVTDAADDPNTSADEGFPTTQGAFQEEPPARINGFVAKVNPSGSGLVYATYLGGNADDSALGVAADPGGRAWVTGTTNSTKDGPSFTDPNNFPTTPDGFQTAFDDAVGANGQVANGFASHFSPDGSALLYSTFLGGPGASGLAIATDPAGKAYVAGEGDGAKGTHSLNGRPPEAPSQVPPYGMTGVPMKSFAAKIDSTRGPNGLVFFTNIASGRAEGIAVTPAGHIWVTGQVAGSDLANPLASTNDLVPTPCAYQSSTPSRTGHWPFAAKLDPESTGGPMSAFLYATYLGKSPDSGGSGKGMATDASGQGYLAGWAGYYGPSPQADPYPTTPGAYQASFNGGPGNGAFRQDAFVTKLDGTCPLSDAAVAVLGIDPRSGPTSGNTTVAVSGNGFIGATKVTFGGIPAASFTVESPNLITAVSPPRPEPGSVHVVVTNQAGVSSETPLDLFEYTQASPGDESENNSAGPAVSGLSPSTGPVRGGTRVAVVGSKFTGATSVNFAQGAVTASPCPPSGGTGQAPCFNLESDTHLTVYSPVAQGPGRVHVTVAAAGKVSPETAADLFEYTAPAPAFSPSAGALPPAGAPGPGVGLISGGGTTLTPAPPGGAPLSVPAGSPGAGPVVGHAGAVVPTPVALPGAAMVPVQGGAPAMPGVAATPEESVKAASSYGTPYFMSRSVNEHEGSAGAGAASLLAATLLTSVGVQRFRRKPMGSGGCWCEGRVLAAPAWAVTR